MARSRKKFGETLVDDGFITTEHLRLALERQVVFGGHLGTNIVELGILSEDDLTQHLGLYMSVPFARPKLLMDVPEDVIACVKKEVAEKYKALPFKKEKKRLHVAMLDPGNFNSVSEMGFMTNFDIVPYVASEVRLLWALEKYYDIKRDVRFVSLVSEKQAEAGHYDPSGAREIDLLMTPPVHGETMLEKPPDMQEKQEPPPAAAPPPARPAAASPPAAPAVEPLPEEKTDEEGPLEEGDDFESVKHAFADIYDREEIAHLLVINSRSVAKRVALMMVKGQNVIGWKADGLELGTFVANAALPSIFNDVVMRRNYYRGPVLQIPGNEEFIAVLGGAPQDSLLMPINIRDRTVALLYADNGTEDVLDAGVSYVNKLAELGMLAFEMLIVKRKIMEL